MTCGYLFVLLVLQCHPYLSSTTVTIVSRKVPIESDTRGGFRKTLVLSSPTQPQPYVMCFITVDCAVKTALTQLSSESGLVCLEAREFFESLTQFCCAHHLPVSSLATLLQKFAESILLCPVALSCPCDGFGRVEAVLFCIRRPPRRTSSRSPRIHLVVFLRGHCLAGLPGWSRRRESGRCASKSRDLSP